jgi:sulfatase modifying factor 1
MKYLTMLLLMLATPTLANIKSIDGFSIYRTEVTVGQLRNFIEATGYVTSAEKRGGGLVYSAGW